jgi:hypothetical protein
MCERKKQKRSGSLKSTIYVKGKKNEEKGAGCVRM